MTVSDRAVGLPVGFSEHGFGETNKAVLAPRRKKSSTPT